MIQLIEENLVRQNKALMLLFILLEEEFSRLMQSNPQSVSQIELSIQELMRQIAVERASLRRKVQQVSPGSDRVGELLESMDQSRREAFEGLLTLLDDTQQKCAVQAAKNHQMAMALFDQSKGLLDFMHNQVKPKNTMSYAATGQYAKVSSSARILTGRL